MNQNIEILVEQAEDWADAQNFYASEHRDYLMAKLARLVVDESLKVLGQNMGYAEFNHAQRQLYTHFGVE